VSNLLTTPLLFPQSSERPFFFTSYVSTIDGKIYVKKPGYWPIGSSTDYEYFTFLRAHADVIVEGKNTALAFGKATISSLHSEKFLSYRKMLGKEKPVEYIILSRTIDSRFAEIIKNEYQFKPKFITSADSEDHASLAEVSTIERLDSKENENSIPSFISYIRQKRYGKVFLDVGPQLLAEFINIKALNELFLTLTPKLFGSSAETVSLGDAELFSPAAIPTFSLISSEKIDDEIFIRYQLRKE
jgi:riboflavin biosynthesis pyrimidine reductase